MKTLASILFINFFCLCGVAMAEDTFEICLQDEFGEMGHLDVHPTGSVVGYSEIKVGDVLVTAGTAFGAFRRLAYPEVMIGGDVNNDCTLGLFPGKLNVIIDVETLTGVANGVLFLCDPAAPGAVVPFVGQILPCPDEVVPAANWRMFFEEDDDEDDDD